MISCDFNNNRLVCGLKCENIQKALLTMSNLTFARAVDIADYIKYIKLSPLPHYGGDS